MNTPRSNYPLSGHATHPSLFPLVPEPVLFSSRHLLLNLLTKETGPRQFEIQQSGWHLETKTKVPPAAFNPLLRLHHSIFDSPSALTSHTEPISISLHLCFGQNLPKEKGDSQALRDENQS